MHIIKTTLLITRPDILCTHIGKNYGIKKIYMYLFFTKKEKKEVDNYSRLTKLHSKN